MKRCYKILLIFFCCLCFTAAKSQLTITGTIYDSTKTIGVKNVLVQSTGGTHTLTDSNGRYSIVTSDRDSLLFIYDNKPTVQFAVSKIPDISSFDISLHIRVTEKFKTMKEVKVYAKNYRQDSIENRAHYAKVFNYQKPGISVNTNSYSGAAGADLNELINIFRFKRNKQLRRMQLRLEEEEKENYINYRFNKTSVRRITRLTGIDLDLFMKAYRPDFEFTATSDVAEFYQYILNASYEYKLNKEKENFITARFNRELVQTISGFTDTTLELFMKKYRPGYEFTKSSSTQQFHDYITAAATSFKQQQTLQMKAIEDSLPSN